MSINYTSDELIKSIKRRGSIPTNQSTFLSVDFLALANDELLDTVVPVIMSARSDYFVHHVDYTMTNEVEYEIPSVAIGMKLKDVCLVLDPGSNDEMISVLPHVPIETNDSLGFYIKNNKVVITGSVSSGSTLRLYYYRRPNKIVEVKFAGQITSINTVTNELTLSQVPAAWVIGDSICCVSSSPSFDLKIISQELQNVSSPLIEIEDVTGLSVGDWICLEGESVIPQIPVEAHSVLAQAVTVKCLESLGDTQGMSNAEAKYDKVLKTLIGLITPRVDDSPKKIVGTNIHSALRKTF